jgi:hypothetical protein
MSESRRTTELLDLGKRMMDAAVKSTLNRPGAPVPPEWYRAILHNFAMEVHAIADEPAGCTYCNPGRSKGKSGPECWTVKASELNPRSLRPEDNRPKTKAEKNHWLDVNSLPKHDLRRIELKNDLKRLRRGKRMK